jgi:hypothetical protein
MCVAMPHNPRISSQILAPVVAKEVASFCDHSNCYFLEHVSGDEVDTFLFFVGVVPDICHFFSGRSKSQWWR